MINFDEFMSMLREYRAELSKIGIYVIDMNNVTKVKTTVQGGSNRSKYLYLNSVLDDNGLAIEGKDLVEWCLDNSNELLFIRYGKEYVTKPPAEAS